MDSERFIQPEEVIHLTGVDLCIYLVKIFIEKYFFELNQYLSSLNIHLLGVSRINYFSGCTLPYSGASFPSRVLQRNFTLRRTPHGVDGTNFGYRALILIELKRFFPLILFVLKNFLSKVITLRQLPRFGELLIKRISLIDSSKVYREPYTHIYIFQRENIVQR